MKSGLSSLLVNIAALALIASGFFLVLYQWPTPTITPIVAEPETSPAGGGARPTGEAQAAAVNIGTDAPLPLATSTTEQTKATTSAKTVVKKVTVKQPVAQQRPPDNQALRIKNPYSFAPVSFESINAITRPALVNILCTPRGAASLSPISGSGVIIDPRGVILTNAHVAQYVLLSQSSRINLSCVIRTGAPATPRWHAEILYIPPVWVEVHAPEIEMKNPVGTGEHDYALLRITGTVDSTPLPSYFPHLPVDTREAIGFKDDQVLVATYPAEFLAAAAQFNMYPASSVTTIGALMTFATKTVDLISLGGIIEAQGGSSGGAVVNAWGRLIALISTTSEGETTATRDLRAVTLSYINRDLATQTQFDIATTLGGDIVAEALDFNTHTAPRLIDLYVAQLGK
ncbi:trypsin-like peptidase domain-containing protein [Candidatus Kaiserbacteria bacterium]|nr:trypsin-like peptidase domain-containing protein [Candidatus Kaiserbacteria bacterium]